MSYLPASPPSDFWGTWPCLVSGHRNENNPNFFFPVLGHFKEKYNSDVKCETDSSLSVYFPINLHYGLHLETLMYAFKNTYFQSREKLSLSLDFSASFRLIFSFCVIGNNLRFCSIFNLLDPLPTFYHLWFSSLIITSVIWVYIPALLLLFYTIFHVFPIGVSICWLILISHGIPHLLQEHSKPFPPSFMWIMSCFCYYLENA